MTPKNPIGERERELWIKSVTIKILTHRKAGDLNVNSTGYINIKELMI